MGPESREGPWLFVKKRKKKKNKIGNSGFQENQGTGSKQIA